MIGLSDTRKKLNVSQEELTTLLNISRQSLADSEIGRRPLPSTAIITFRSLRDQMQLKDLQSSEQVWADEEGEEILRKNNLDRIEECEHQLRTKRRELSLIKRHYEDAILALSYLQWLIDNPGELTEENQTWLRGRRAIEKQRLDRIGLAKQREIEVKIGLLEREIEMRGEN